MKYLLLFIIAVPTSLSAQEKYFYELKGMEDSTGTTHLFHRMHEKTSFQCSEENGGQLIISTHKNVNHFNTKTSSDSVKFRDYYGPWCLSGFISFSGVYSYDFIRNDISKPILIKGFGNYDWQPPFLANYQDSTLGFPYPIIIKQATNEYYGYPEDVLIATDSIYLQLESHTIPLDLNASNWPTYGEDYDKFISFLDSATFEFELTNIHPKVDSLFYATKGNYSYLSENYHSEFRLADSSNLFSSIYFDAAEHILYSVVNNQLLRSDDYGRANSWTTIDILESISDIRQFITDSFVNGLIFLSDSKSIYKSINYGDSFELLLELDHTITGLYKKPDSSILYVLTTDELFELDTETKEVTFLKKLPVSNEETKETPSSVKLHQNYPNPFNPTTTISFELDKPSEITLTVFDALGRRVSELLDGQFSAGYHQIQFNAGNLSSGMYIYRLQAGNKVFTKKLTLIK